MKSQSNLIAIAGAALLSACGTSAASSELHSGFGIDNGTRGSIRILIKASHSNFTPGGIGGRTTTCGITGGGIVNTTVNGELTGSVRARFSKAVPDVETLKASLAAAAEATVVTRHGIPDVGTIEYFGITEGAAKVELKQRGETVSDNPAPVAADLEALLDLNCP